MTVWESVETLEKFVWSTIYKQFFARRSAWFEILGGMHFVMWCVPDGHRPTLDEALSRLEMRRAQGDTAEAFGWDWLKEAQMYKTHRDPT